MDKLKKVVESKYFKITSFAVAVVVFSAIVFAAGIGVGMHKAKYSYQWGENYERNFAGGSDRRQMGQFGPGGFEGPKEMRGPEGMMGFFRGDGGQLRNANGIAGTIVSITDNLIIVKDKDNKENTIAVDEKTIIKNGRNDIKIGDLKNDQRIVVIGQPGENGTIVAQLIRVFESAVK